MSDKGVKTFVSDLSPISQQVGNHIITALKQPNTAAVLTSIVPGFPTDRIASIPLTPAQMVQVRRLLAQEQLEMIEAEAQDDRSIGFRVDEEK